MKRRLLTSLLILLLLSACSPSPITRSSPYQLYFLSTANYGPAILSQPCPIDEVSSPEQLILALLNGPDDESLRSPFPQGLSLRRCIQEGTHIIVDFSEQYSGLSDISLTLADYCVVLTLCQLDGIESVEITVSGRPISYRSHQILTGEEVTSDTNQIVG